MRNVPTLRTVLLAATLSTACADAPPPWPQPVHEQTATVMGGAAADQLTGTLIAHLTAALDSAGAAGAIDFCATEASVLTAGAAPEGVEIKRTTHRTRNPANAPDSLEVLALEYFESQLDATGALPTSWIQAEGDVALRYYRPLVVNQLCVQCHGPMEALSPEVLEILGERYPQDRATGYLPGDFRGLIRVRVPRNLLDAG